VHFRYILQRTFHEPLPFRIDSDEFNLSAERYYRNSLRKRHVREALALFEEDLRAMDRGFYRNDALSKALRFAVREEGATQFMQRIRGEVIDEKVSPDGVVQLIYLIIIVEYFERLIQRRREEEHDTPPIYRAGNAWHKYGAALLGQGNRFPVLEGTGKCPCTVPYRDGTADIEPARFPEL